MTQEEARQWTMTLRDEIERGDIYAAASTAATLNDRLTLTIDINDVSELKGIGWKE